LPFDNDEELLYRRHTQHGDLAILQSLPENEIGSKIFQLKDDSYNRSLYSTSEQVLLNDNPTEERGEDFYKTWGIISIPVKAINTFRSEIMLNNKTQVCTLKVAHTANKCNYSHSEIYCYIDNERHCGKAPKSAIPFFRRELQKILQMNREYQKPAVNQ
jgi:hypothetical protein